jgi:nickel superoxide dismutase
MLKRLYFLSQFQILKQGGPPMKKKIILSLILIFLFFLSPKAFSHCEVPCGIYDDQMRFAMIKEHITTIEKAMKQIEELSAQSPQNMNQIVRWIVNKEKHAEEIQHIISQYFMTQRVKPADRKDSVAYKKHVEKLTLCHQILVYAMKAKQTTDLADLEKLRSLLQAFKSAYFGKK